MTDVSASGAPLRIVHTESSRGWGGQEIRVLEEAAGFIRRGHHVQLLCSPDARIHEEAQRRGIAVQALPIGRKRPVGVLAMRQWIAGHDVDVINTHSSTDSWLAALACASLRAAPPLVRTRHISAAIPNNFTTRWLYTRATRHIVTTGEALREQLIRDNGYAPACITSIPTGIDTERFKPGDRLAARAALGIAAERPLVGIVATLRSWKGHADLLDAMVQVPQADLIIVGDGPQREAIKERIARLGLSTRVRLAGNQQDVLPWLHAFDVFVLPSYANEGVPQALLQAMLCALPCITTNIGAIPEIAMHQRTALVVLPCQPAELANALQRLLADAALARQLGEAARSWCAQRHALEQMLDRMAEVFRAAKR